MLNEENLLEYENDFTQLGITDKDEQKAVLDFFYTLGTIIYNS